MFSWFPVSSLIGFGGREMFAGQEFAFTARLLPGDGQMAQPTPHLYHRFEVVATTCDQMEGVGDLAGTPKELPVPLPGHDTE
jgi:hypothetical protein